MSKLNAIWVKGKDMKNVNLKTLSDNGINVIYLNFAAITEHSKAGVEAFIDSAKNYNINVHIWMQVLYKNGWQNPINNNSLLQEKIEEAEQYAQIKGITGINLDYIRFPGTAKNYTGATESVTNFVTTIANAIHQVDKGLIVSGSLMPEPTSKSYGQDAVALSEPLDVLTPMVYKGNYNASSNWIGKVSKWYSTNISKADVLIGLQSYKSDSDVTKLSESELQTDINTALTNGADGIALFRYGLTNFVKLTIDSQKGNQESNKNNEVKNITTVTDLTWVNKQIKKAVFKDMISRVEKYIKDGGIVTDDRRVYVNMDTPTEFVTYQRYKEMKSRWDSFQKLNNYEPNWIWCKSPTIDITNIDYKIQLKTFKDMKSRVEKFLSDGGSISSNRRIYLDIVAQIQYVQYWRYQKLLSRYTTYMNTKGREPNYLIANNDPVDNNTDSNPTSTGTTTNSPVGKKFTKAIMNQTALTLRNHLRDKGVLPDSIQMTATDNLTYTLNKSQYMGLYETQNGYIVKNNAQPSYTTLVSIANNPLVWNHQDTKYTCCPTSNSMGIGMLFDFHSETQLAKLFGTSTSGTSPSSMVSALNNLGYKCTRMNRTLENVTNAINKGYPVVCHYQTKPASSCTGFIYDYGHYCLIYGISDGKYLIADPTKGMISCKPSIMNAATDGRAIYYYALSPA